MEFKPRKKHLRVDHLSWLSTEVGIEDIDNEFLDDQLFAIRAVPTWYEHLDMFFSTQKYLEGLDKNERRKINDHIRYFETK